MVQKSSKPKSPRSIHKARVAAAGRAKAVRLGWKPLESIVAIDLKAALLKNDELSVITPHLKKISHD